jgi:predicted ribosome quality control (RQC) complex YloA/Tae2 family protein
MNLLLLHLFARDARAALVGRRINSVGWFAPVLTIELGGARRPRVWLCAVMEPPGPFACLLREPPLEGAAAPARFDALCGTEIVDVSVFEDDRILRIDTRRDDHADTSALILYLFGASGRIVLRRGSSTLESIGRRIPDEKRAAARTGIARIDQAALEATAETGALAGDASPQPAVPGLARELLRAFTRGNEIDTGALVDFRNTLVAGGSPFRLAAAGKTGDAVPIPDTGGGMDGGDGPEGTVFGPFRDAVAACGVVGEVVLATTKARMVERLAGPLRRRLASNRKLMRNLQGDIERAQGHEALRREAELLAAFRSQIPPGAGSTTLNDIHGDGTPVSIELDPAEPIHAQIDQRFRRATKMEKSLSHAGRRLALVEGEIEEIDAVLRLLSQTGSLSDAMLRLEAARARFEIEDRRTGTRTKVQQRQERVPRRFELDENWFALVGRNNQDNDEITFKHAAPTDMWFHAQGVPGSHVVLKAHGGRAGNPPERIVEVTASIAAHFSKARHSALVPVIYTQRKYVRKFRGARAGQVKCEREKMVMVAPVLPDTDED